MYNLIGNYYTNQHSMHGIEDDSNIYGQRGFPSAMRADAFQIHEKYTVARLAQICPDDFSTVSRFTSTENSRYNKSAERINRRWRL